VNQENSASQTVPPRAKDTLQRNWFTQKNGSSLDPSNSVLRDLEVVSSDHFDFVLSSHEDSLLVRIHIGCENVTVRAVLLVESFMC